MRNLQFPDMLSDVRVLDKVNARQSAPSRGPDKIIVFGTIFKFFSKSDLITEIILSIRL